MSNRERVALAFVEARRVPHALTDYPGTPPADLADAYAIQDRALEIDGRSVVGWKVGKINPPVDAQLGANRLAGPIFADQLQMSASGDGPPMPVIGDGFAAAEAEYCVRIGRAAPAGVGRMTPDQVLDLIDAVHVGIEIASSPYPGINADGPLVTISDYGNNYGLLIGDPIPNWRSLAFIDWQVESLIDGERIGAATARTMLDGPIGAVAFLIDSLAARGIALQPGQWVSSGAVTGVHQVRPGDRFDARFGKDMRVRCTIEAATPRGEMRGETEHGAGSD